MKKIRLSDKFSLLRDFWIPRIAAELNDSYVKLAKLKGEFVWHYHEREDELFLVIKGQLLIRLRDGEVRLGPGELVVIPRGVEHLPIASEEVDVMLIEPKTTINTGNTTSGKTVTGLEWI
jgi:mannose-6-phosphate isomerase-like protein (cupin superfamily)